ncbi:hypothetical protein RNZ50_02855 [Paracoccaceae bacterium Fryx2]|nr:hypothetical protein [Paracoccaceae bacterium Fryx2]
MMMRVRFALLIAATTAACTQPPAPAPDPLAEYAGAEYWYSAQPGTRPGAVQAAAPGTAAPKAVSDLRIAAPAGSQAAALFRQVCLSHDGNFAASVPAASATGAFGTPERTTRETGAQRYSFLTPDGRIEAVIVTGDPFGDSCGVGRLDLNETYIIGPGVRFVPK